jgi:hypothetical protein
MALKCQAEHLPAERILVTIGLHVGQLGVIEVALRLERLDDGVLHNRVHSAKAW